MIYLRKHLVTIVAVALIIIVLLVIANLIKFGYFTTDIIIKNKDLINVTCNIFTTFIILIGAIISYFRFFRGRIFSNNANIELNISVHNINNDSLLHVINVNLKNEGTFPIWEPIPMLIAYPHRLSALGTAIEINFWEPEILKSKDYVRVINSLESEQFCAFYRVKKNIKALTYFVLIKSRDNVKWTKSITVSNQVTN
jgi:hypothetical protein